MQMTASGRSCNAMRSTESMKGEEGVHACPRGSALREVGRSARLLASAMPRWILRVAQLAAAARPRTRGAACWRGARAPCTGRWGENPGRRHFGGVFICPELATSPSMGQPMQARNWAGVHVYVYTCMHVRICAGGGHAYAYAQPCGAARPA